MASEPKLRDDKFSTPFGVDEDGDPNTLKPGEKPPLPVIIDAPKPDGGDLNDYDWLLKLNEPKPVQKK